MNLIVFQSDWTYMEGAVASTYGVIKSVNPQIEIITATHEIPKFDIYSASYRLSQYVSFWPKGTIFVSVVDPGVGTNRRACIARSEDGYYFVTPDNGALTHINKRHPIIEVREIDEERNRLATTKGVAIFHGRDLFGYCAAKLAAGIITYEEVGEAYPVEEIVKFDIEDPTYYEDYIEGFIEIDDPNFGNIWTNIRTEKVLELFPYGEEVFVEVRKNDEVIYAKNTVFSKAFGDVEKGEVVLYNNELMKVALAVSQGSFLEEYKAGFGLEYRIKIGGRHE